MLATFAPSPLPSGSVFFRRPKPIDFEGSVLESISKNIPYTSLANRLRFDEILSNRTLLLVLR